MHGSLARLEAESAPRPIQTQTRKLKKLRSARFRALPLHSERRFKRGKAKKARSEVSRKAESFSFAPTGKVTN